MENGFAMTNNGGIGTHLANAQVRLVHAQDHQENCMSTILVGTHVLLKKWWVVFNVICFSIRLLPLFSFSYAQCSLAAM